MFPAEAFLQSLPEIEESSDASVEILERMHFLKPDVDGIGIHLLPVQVKIVHDVGDKPRIWWEIFPDRYDSRPILSHPALHQITAELPVKPQQDVFGEGLF